jgi:AcrR family transcriptional regulator
MAKEKVDIEKNASTEEKIKAAARLVFMQKGYAATRTRDIADASGYNLALINYYFRSKEKLFNIIMVEHLQVFVANVAGILNDETTTLKEKISILVGHYIDMLIKNPDLPLFIFNAVRTDPQSLIEQIGLGGKRAEDLLIVKQWREVARKKVTNLNPLHIVINLISMTIFPFVGKPVLQNRTGMSTEQFNKLMEERKRLIPLWISAIINCEV